MTTLDTLTALASTPLGYGVGGGTLLAALGPLVRSLPGVLRRILDVWASARERREETRLERARTERVEAETDAAQVTLSAAMLAEMQEQVRAATRAAAEAVKDAREARDRVEACERRHADAAAKAAERERVHAREVSALRSEVASLRYEMKRRGITPPDGRHSGEGT